MKKFIQCDCCDYFTIPAEGDYEICPICFWEQDSFGIDMPSEPSGANHGLSLHEGRANFQKYGASSPEMIKNVLHESERTLYEHVARAV